MAATSHKLMAAGATIVIAEPALAMAHTGGLGVICGLVAGVIAYNAVDDVEKVAGKTIPSLPATKQVTESNKPSVLYRMLNGKSVRGEVVQLSQNTTAQPEPQKLLEHQRATEDTSSGKVLYDDSDIYDAKHTITQKKNAMFRFSELLATGWRPSKNQIFVGRTMERKDIFVPATSLCHVAIAGKTGGGKGSIMRLIMTQLCYIGAQVLLLNPHYMRWVVADNGSEFDEDWSPFEGINPRTQRPYLEVSPLESAEFRSIDEYLEWAVETLLSGRIREGRAGGVRFKPYFIVLDEWPSIVGKVKKAPDYLSFLLREGRKYGVFVFVASQDFQVKTIGMDGGSVRKCLLTTFYTGGDKTTGKELLDFSSVDEIPEHRLGKGVVMVKCAGTENKAVEARVPFVDNESVYLLLGPSTYAHSSQKRVVEARALPTPIVAPMPDIPAKQIAPPTLPTQDLVQQLAKTVDQDTLSALISKLDARKETVRNTDALEEIPDEFEAKQPAQVVAYQPTRKPSTALSPELQQALQVYQAGHTSHRDFMRVLGVTKYKAGHLQDQLRSRRLID
jgi:hypothetical protein